MSPLSSIVPGGGPSRTELPLSVPRRLGKAFSLLAPPFAPSAPTQNQTRLCLPPGLSHALLVWHIDTLSLGEARAQGPPYSSVPRQHLGTQETRNYSIRLRLCWFSPWETRTETRYRPSSAPSEQLAGSARHPGSEADTQPGKWHVPERSVCHPSYPQVWTMLKPFMMTFWGDTIDTGRSAKALCSTVLLLRT